ncbi:hypothetical protein [Streptomyces sp. 1222.5]|uniref:hypothetical protein n=1 Tax=Streptomyces sp. 1222.5 TaxID=1881026 RepID=UPI003EBC31E2
MYALRIDPEATVTDLNLPAANAHIAIQERLGSDTVRQGVYHRRGCSARVPPCPRSRLGP